MNKSQVTQAESASERRQDGLRGYPRSGERELNGGADHVTRRNRGPGARWVALGVGAAAAGFLGASVNPGAGPRTVHGSLTVGPFYLPPLLVSVVLAIVALLAARRVRYSVALGGVVAAVMLIGSGTTGSAAISYRISHPARPLGFVEDWLQLLGEIVALAAAVLIGWRRRDRSTAR